MQDFMQRGRIPTKYNDHKWSHIQSSYDDLIDFFISWLNMATDYGTSVKHWVKQEVSRPDGG